MIFLDRANETKWLCPPLLCQVMLRLLLCILMICYSAGWLSRCLSSRCCPLIVPLQRLVVKSPLNILLLRPLLIVLLPRLLVVLAFFVLLLRRLLGFSSRRLAFLSFCCAALLVSHCAGWSLSHLSSSYPLVVSLFWPVIASPLPPLLLLLPPLVATAVDVRPIPVPMCRLFCVNVPHTLP